MRLRRRDSLTGSNQNWLCAGSPGDDRPAAAILAGTLPAHSLNVVDPTPADLAEQMLWAAGPSDPEIVRLCLPHMKRPRDDGPSAA